MSMPCVQSMSPRASALLRLLDADVSNRIRCLAGVVHVEDVVTAHTSCMTNDDASGRYLVTRDMVRIEDVFETLKSLFPAAPIATPDNMDYASGTPGRARAIESRTEKELGVQLHDLRSTLKDAVDSMVAHGLVAACA